MSLRLLVSCDSDPAPYAGASAERCRAWLPVPTTQPVEAIAAALRAGWTYEHHADASGLVVDRTTCPACAAAHAAQGVAVP